MANKLYKEESIQAIADAIREKNGSSDTYKVGDMAGAISEISGGHRRNKLSGTNALSFRDDLLPR